MNHIKQGALQFADSIRQSDEYNKYHGLKEQLMKDEKLYARINELRRRSFEIQIKPDTDAYEESNRLRVEYEELFNNLIVNEFLIAEQRICKMMREVNNILMNSIDMGLDFLD